MKLKKTLIALLALLFSSASIGVEVKGLELGQVTSLQALANNFGNADCPGDILSPSSSARKDLYESYGFNCNVPISYLGIKTSAKIRVSLQWIVKEITIEIPNNLLNQVETFITKKYGKPDVVRGEVKVVQLRNVGETQTHPKAISDQCSRWKNLDEVYIEVCEQRGASSLFNITYNGISYRYVTPKILDETDL